MSSYTAGVTVTVHETLKHIQPYLPPAPATILEFGCGKGHLAQKLQEMGYFVTAIDPNEKDVEFARSLGVHATVADFTKYDTDQNFDVILGVVVLHHISDISAALNAIKKFIKPGGICLIEEFRLENVDHNTAKWFFDMEELLQVSQVIAKREYHYHHHHHHSEHQHHHHHHHSEHHDHKQQEEHEDHKQQEEHDEQDKKEHEQTYLEKWQRMFNHHHPPLHIGQFMLDELKKLGGDMKVQMDVPMFYRFIISGLEQKRLNGTDKDQNYDIAVAEKVLEIEQSNIAERRINGLGMTIIIQF
jgi:2-polyprenyl-3-methyl-5-hydroxy-6-metoxy-1,4-benzoquinol methylase